MFANAFANEFANAFANKNELASVFANAFANTFANAFANNLSIFLPSTSGAPNDSFLPSAEWVFLSLPSWTPAGHTVARGASSWPYGA